MYTFSYLHTGAKKISVINLLLWLLWRLNAQVCAIISATAINMTAKLIIYYANC